MYAAVADFRASTPQWWTQGLNLSVGQAPDTQLGAAIQAMSDRIDSYTGDHFEPQAAAVVLVDSIGGTELAIPRRIRSVTSVETQSSSGVWTVQAGATYRVQGSLVGVTIPLHGSADSISIIAGESLSNVDEAGAWPIGPQTVRVTGDFGWAACPEEIKRAVSLMVWDKFSPLGDKLRRASTYSDDSGQYDIATTKPTGIPEADEIIGRHDRTGRFGLTTQQASASGMIDWDARSTFVYAGGRYLFRPPRR